MQLMIYKQTFFLASQKSALNPTWCQTHNHFMSIIFILKCYEKLFCAYSLCSFFWKKKIVDKTERKIWTKSTPSGIIEELNFTNHLYKRMSRLVLFCFYK